jgi:alcohol dehydrogenase YqhD (iron-dependent ADH family)
MIVEQPITAALLTASAAAYYTSPTNLKRAIIKAVSFTNIDTVPQTVTVHMVPLGGTAVDANKLIAARSLNAGETWQCTEAENKILLAGGMLQALASTLNKVNIQGSVLEHSF